MLETIISELSALSSRDRAAVLDALEPAERARIEAAMGMAGAGAGETRRHSAWMEALLEADGGMTAEARAALLSAAGRTRPVAERAAPTSRSLLQAAGRALTR